ncbi:MAG TPA: type III-B CRISPR-associated protein Cas10/Cmr2 [Ktedonobacteraceae bacterium]|nr:type III-B CRISPR-associated protein Cas10/Cmr2 [Ktedonobacteraceae bacterium]
MQYLFQVAIGPVQGFIASARRSRDLWFGSRLLSEVSKIVALTIAETYSLHSLIFPAPKSLDESLDELKFGSELNVANKIVACITIPDNSQKQVSTILENLDKEIRTNISKKINEIKDQVYGEIARNAKKAEYDGELFNEKMANAQIADLVELSWAAVPYEGQYNKAREKLERLMAARKNTRNFRQVEWGSEQLKSSIDGQLEGVVDKSFYSSKDLKTREEQARQLYKIFHAGPNERLSGVDLLKRLGTFPGKEFFPSTSHLAAIPYLERLKRAALQKEVQPALQKYIDAVQDVLRGELDIVPDGYRNYQLLGRYDGALFYPERHRDKVTEGASLAKAQKKLKAFFDDVKKALGENVEPSPYYAIICADGDYMGKLIDTLASDDDGMSKHQELSKALDSFSREVKGIVEKHKGALIYAGGDDVLAFLPLHSVLACAEELAKEFSKKLADKFSEHLKDSTQGVKKENPPSLSVGIAIVHHLTMLHEALNLGRAAETKAKGVKGKNALAITVNKRSGEQYSIAGPRKALYSTLDEFIDHFHYDRLPRGVAYELQAMQERLTVIDASDSSDAQQQSDTKPLKEIMYLEAKRILRRKLNLPQSRLLDNVSAEDRQKQNEERKKLAEKILNRLLAHIEGAPDPSNNAKGEAATAKVSLAAFIQELIVAQELAAAKTLVEGKPSSDARDKEVNV